MDGRKRTAGCLALLFGLSLVTSPPWTHPRNVLSSKNSDVLSQHYPWRLFAVSSLRETGELPLWTPYANSGQPFQADAQTTLFYPPHWLFLLVPITWVGPLFGVLVWGHVVLAGWSMFFYARHRGLSYVPALVAGVGFMFAGKWLLHVLLAGHYVFAPLAWFPLLVLFVERAVAGRFLPNSLAAGLVLAAMVTGLQPQLTLYAGLLGGLSTLGTAAAIRPRFVGLARWGGAWVLVSFLAATLAAVQLLPSLESAGFTTRVHTTTLDYGRFYDLTFRNGKELAHRILSIVGPKNFGANAWENVGAFGVLWSALAVLALAFCRRRGAWPFGLLLLFQILFAFGTTLPLYPILCHLVPPLGVFRIPGRVLVFAGFPLGMLAGLFTQTLLDGQLLSRRRLVWAGWFVLGAVYVYFCASLDTDAEPYRYWFEVLVLGLGVAVLLWLCPRRTPAGRLAVGVLWLLLLTSDLWAIHRRHVRTTPLEDVYPDNEVVRFLKEQPGDFRVLDRPLNPGVRTFSPLTQALCNLHHIPWVRGLNVTDLFHYKQFLNFITGDGGPPELQEIALINRIAHPQLLDLLGVRYLLCPAKDSLEPVEQKSWKPVRTFSGTRLFLETDASRGGMHRLPPFILYRRTSDPLPTAFVVAQAGPLAEKDDALIVLQSTNFREKVLFDPVQVPEPQQYPGRRFQEAAVISRFPNRLVVEVDRDMPGYLVLSEIWYPGWQCRMEDGQVLPVQRANFLLRAVAIPAGKHQFEFVFRPASYTVGKAISAISLFVVVCTLALLRFCPSRSISLPNFLIFPFLPKKSKKTISPSAEFVSYS